MAGPREGIIANQRSALDERMMAAVVGSIKAAEVIIAVVDASALMCTPVWIRLAPRHTSIPSFAPPCLP